MARRVSPPSSNAYVGPDDIWEVNSQLRPEEPLAGESDPRWVDTAAARGAYNLQRLYRSLGVDMNQSSGERLRSSTTRGYYLFFGHRGCGKSTELGRIRDDLDAHDLYYVIFADAAQELDVNNLRYQDILFHLAAKLVGRLEQDHIRIDPVHLRKLEEWFRERIEQQEKTRAFAQDVRAGAGVSGGLPFIGKAFANMSTAFKTNSTYKEEFRRTLQNYFTGFADAFNHLIESATEAVAAARKGARILFVVDGTDLLRGEDANALFVNDVHQLRQVCGMFLYCAPIHLIYQGVGIGQSFDDAFKLPMLKVANADGSQNEPGRTTMREILYRRAAPSLFDPGVADLLIDHSGGHPRDILRLLQYAFRHATKDRFDEAAAEAAIRETATEFRRFLGTEDYELLAEIDSHPDTPPHTERARELLYNLALLEYNDFYCRSHPVIRTINAYKTAREALASGDD